MNDKTSTISCPSCATVYRIAAERIGAGGRILKCGVCGHRFLVRPLVAAGSPSPTVAERPAAPVSPPGPVISAPPMAPVEPPAPAAVEEPLSAMADLPATPDEIDTGGWEVDQTPAAPAFELPEEAAADGLDLEIPAGDDADVETARFSALSFDEVRDEDLSIDLDLDEAEEPAAAAKALEDDGVVEFLVEDDAGGINRVETHATDEPHVSATRRHERRVPLDVEMPDDTMVRGSMPGFGSLDEETPSETVDDVKDAVLIEDEPQAKHGKKEAGRWRDPSRGGTTRKKTLLKRESEASPTSGIFYLVLVMLIGGAAIATNFINLESWRFDPVWAGSLIGLGLLGFFLQNLSGLYIAGFFGLIHALSLFSRQKPLIESSDFNGAIHLGIIVGFSLIFLVIYYILMNRKRGRFFVREGKGQSLTAFFLGLGAVVLGYWAHLVAGPIPALGRFTISGTPIADFTYYGGTPLDVVFQAGLLSLAIAFGISSRRLSNRLILLGVLGILLGLAVMFLLFAPLLMGEIQFMWPV